MNEVVILVIIGILIVALVIDNYRLSGKLFQVDQLGDGSLHHENLELALLGIAAMVVMG